MTYFQSSLMASVDNQTKEECDDCNNKLSKIESNLMHYLDVRGAMVVNAICMGGKV